MINEFIDKILVHAPDKSSGERVQEVEIYLKYIGKFDTPLPEPTPEEIAEQERLKKERARSCARYQRLKAGTAEHSPYTRVCKCCGKQFTAMASRAFYCSPRCRAKVYQIEAAEKRRRECTCPNCGKTFSTTRNDVKYCCEACRIEKKRQNKATKPQKTA